MDVARHQINELAEEARGLAVGAATALDGALLLEWLRGSSQKAEGRASKLHSANKLSFDQNWFKFIAECCLYLNGFHVFPQIKGENNMQ